MSRFYSETAEQLGGFFVIKNVSNQILFISSGGIDAIYYTKGDRQVVEWFFDSSVQIIDRVGLFNLILFLFAMIAFAFFMDAKDEDRNKVVSRVRDFFTAITRWLEERQMQENAITSQPSINFHGLYWFSLFIDLPSAGVRALIFYLFVLFPSALVVGLLALILDANSLNQLMRADPRSLSGGYGFLLFQWFIYFMFRLGLFLAYLPVILSLVSLVGITSGGVFTRWALGARVPSMRERAIMSDSLGHISEIAPKRGKTQFHSSWWVIDNNFPRTYTIGTTLYVTTEALKDNHFTAMLAHELGHFAKGDGLKVKALRNLVYPVAQHVFTTHKDLGQERGVILTTAQAKQAVTISPSPDFARTAINQIVRLIYPMLFGGLGVYLLSPIWARYFRIADYIADDFVVECGLGHELMEHLEEWAVIDHAVPFWDNWTPYTELRLDRLRTHLGG